MSFQNLWSQSTALRTPICFVKEFGRSIHSHSELNHSWPVIKDQSYGTSKELVTHLPSVKAGSGSEVSVPAEKKSRAPPSRVKLIQPTSFLRWLIELVSVYLLHPGGCFIF